MTTFSQVPSRNPRNPCRGYDISWRMIKYHRKNRVLLLLSDYNIETKFLYAFHKEFKHLRHYFWIALNTLSDIYNSYRIQIQLIAPSIVKLFSLVNPEESSWNIVYHLLHWFFLIWNTHTHKYFITIMSISLLSNTYNRQNWEDAVCIFYSFYCI